MAEQATGRVTQVMGAVIDVEFEGELPTIYTALKLPNPSIDDNKISKYINFRVEILIGHSST